MAVVPPGRYHFRVSARHVGEPGDIAYAAAILEVRSTAQCDDDTTWYKYSLITHEIVEATEVTDLLPGDTNPEDPTCRYFLHECVPIEATGMCYVFFMINILHGTKRIWRSFGIKK